MFANHKDVSNISRVEVKRGSNNTRAVLEAMNCDDYQRPKAQDRAMKYQKNTLVWKQKTNALPLYFVFEMFAKHKDVSNISRVEAKRETISIQAVLKNMVSMILKGLKPRTKRYIIKTTRCFWKDHEHIIPRFVF